ncbi:unnamed protein product [Lactuca virosa]|uniref:Poly A polymerase head domain-containing protein n=1 Tax=Lactuca virosa TaxID=75947 RepID=A0AAU9MH01_9ASTR|nr:unnamed protein product [Lactuca virosa]
MAGISVKRHTLLSRFKILLPSQCLYHKFAEVRNKPRPRSDKGSDFEPGEISISKWKKMDSRSLGISRTMVPSAPYTLLKILQTQGFEAYLVGGCVRDLLLNRTPKDFDVITTADLNQIKKQFHRCHIVGRRFPICMVHIKGSIIEVSSFKTLAKHSEDKEKFLVSHMPRNCDKSDLKLWKNSMHRDFTVNSLFFDPLMHKIYDYSNGMKDLLELKLRTLVPANLSFTEDCARILRGLRIAARLGLSFSKDIESAIHKHASSLLDLSQSRIMMEIDYMLSYGAAESSIRLLHKYHILEILFPFQAAYISRQTSGSEQCSMMMLMKMFLHMDKLFSCDHPCTFRLWIGVLAFHQALVKKPQDSLVVLTLASVLYHQEWKGGVEFVRQCSPSPVSFKPEISESSDLISDDELSEKVSQLALNVLDSINGLVKDTDRMQKTKSKLPHLIFISKNSGHGAAQLFNVVAHNVENYNKGRSCFEMEYGLLGKGDVSETRFALGKIILNTMGCRVDDEEDENKQLIEESDSRLWLLNDAHMKQKWSTRKKQNILVTEVKKIKDEQVFAEEMNTFESRIQKLASISVGNERFPSELELEAQTETLKVDDESKSITQEQILNRRSHKRKGSLSILSSLFK